jgi:hypothetical protein
MISHAFKVRTTCPRIALPLLFGVAMLLFAGENVRTGAQLLTRGPLSSAGKPP